MTDRELQLTAFTAYDSDNNGKLDGTELVKSLIHWHGEKLWPELYKALLNPGVSLKVLDVDSILNSFEG